MLIDVHAEYQLISRKKCAPQNNNLVQHSSQDLIKQDIKPLEEGLTYDEIYIMRSLALNRVQRMSPPVTPRQQGGGWTSWVTGWGWGYYSQTAPTSPGPGTED